MSRKVASAFVSGLLSLLIGVTVANARASASSTSGVVQPQNPVSWKRFVDQEGSSIEVPISIVRPVKSDDPTKLTFDSMDRRTTIEFYTTTEMRAGFPGNDPEGDMDLKRSDCNSWPPPYRVVKDKLAAYSCLKDNSVTYYVGKYVTCGGVHLFVEYPETERLFWDKAVQHMANSMRQVEREPMDYTPVPVRKGDHLCS